MLLLPMKHGVCACLAMCACSLLFVVSLHAWGAIELGEWTYLSSGLVSNSWSVENEVKALWSY